VPLAEIAPDVLHPLLRVPIGTLAKRVQRDPDIHCSSCGYNLRGLPVNGHCPECGKSIKETLEELAELDPTAHEQLRRAGLIALAALAGCAVDGVLFVMDAVALAERTLQDSGKPISARSVCAAATTVTPPATRRQTAWCKTSWLVSPQLESSEPAFATLILTASMSGFDESLGSRWARTQSRPQTYHDSRP